MAGGVRLVEPAADLAVTVALMSSYLDRPVPEDLAVWGEVGLTGEVRGVTHTDLRLGEARKLGFARTIVPASNADRLPASLPEWLYRCALARGSAPAPVWENRLNNTAQYVAKN